MLTDNELREQGEKASAGDRTASTRLPHYVGYASEPGSRANKEWLAAVAEINAVVERSRRP